MTQAVASPLQDQLKVIRDRFIVLLADRRYELQDLRKHLENSEPNEDIYKQIQFIVHKIAGTAGTLGFPEFGQLALNTETIIVNHLSKQDASDTDEGAKEAIDIFIKSASEIK